MGLDISIMRPQKVDRWESIQNYNFVTILTEFGEFIPSNEIYRVFEPYFFTAKIEYFDINKSIYDSGYLESDLHFKSCRKIFTDNSILLLERNFCQKHLWKSPITEDFIIDCEIKITEKRRYDFWWEFVTSMRTKKKKLSGELTLQNHSTYRFNEMCLYHPQISYQRGGMNAKFYDEYLESFRYHR